MKNTVSGFDNDAIRKMFREYVENTGGNPRHTKEADYEVGLFDAFLDGAFPGNMKLRDELHTRMMNCAVEFEESGFTAGVEFILKRFEDITESLRIDHSPPSPVRPNHSPPVPVRPDNSPAAAIRPGNSSARPESGTPSQKITQETLPRKSAQETGKTVLKSSQLSVSRPVQPENRSIHTDMKAVPAAISSKQIAELFETSNAKVVKRIEESILPRLDTQSRQYFRMEIELTPTRRRQKVYYLNKAACNLYMAEMEPHKKYINIAGGLVKMRELMNIVFPVEAA